jgi:hypothetical protein
MTWDAAYYEDLAGRLYGLLITFDDRLPGEQARQLHRFIEVGEYGLALEEITGALAQHKIAITDQECRGMLDLGLQMKLQGDLVPRALSHCPRVARPASSGSADPPETSIWSGAPLRHRTADHLHTRQADTVWRRRI